MHSATFQHNRLCTDTVIVFRRCSRFRRGVREEFRSLFFEVHFSNRFKFNASFEPNNSTQHHSHSTPEHTKATKRRIEASRDALDLKSAFHFSLPPLLPDLTRQNAALRRVQGLWPDTRNRHVFITKNNFRGIQRLTFRRRKSHDSSSIFPVNPARYVSIGGSHIHDNVCCSRYIKRRVQSWLRKFFHVYPRITSGRAIKAILRLLTLPLSSSNSFVTKFAGTGDYGCFPIAARLPILINRLALQSRAYKVAEK